MRITGRARQYIKYLSCVLAVTIGIIQPCAALAVEEGQAATQDDSQEAIVEGDGDVSADVVKYITGFETLTEEDAYLSCMYKPSLEELLGVFPETIFVWSEGAEAPEELEVRWECEEDFDATQSEIYIFYPKWDETLYTIADAAADNVEIPCITVEVPVESEIIKDLEGAKSALKNISDQKSILAIVYLCDKYDVKESPSADSGTIRTVSSGQSVQITGVEMGEYGDVWYRVLFYQSAAEYTGYVEREYLATSNEAFADWEDTYIDLSEAPMMMAFSMGYPDVDQFPASYQNALYALKDKHPNWTFVRMDTGLDWNTAIAKEMGDKSLISSKTSGSWQNGSYGQGWSYASEGILKYYMDPRNFLTDPYIFQFEQLTYNESYHTTSSVQEVIKNSFMSSTIPGDSRTYAQAFTEIGKSQDVSPFHLAARVLQEQGTQGTSPLISGTYSGYEGYYNYFNVEAAGKTNLEVIINGLKRAVASGWNTRFKSLNGGAAVIGANYITKGQDTVYLEKFNVSNGMYPNFTHQYMQNIQAPASEAANIRKAYNNAGALENSFVFKIPVYNNMPASACSKPETTDSITLNQTTVSSLEVNKTVTLIPYVNGSKVDSVSNMTFTSSNTSVATVDSQGRVTGVSPGTATISCTRSGANTATCTVTVVKTNPNVPTPVLSPYTYREGLKLSDIVLPDGWTWEKGNTQIAVGTFSYPALYTPTDTTKYNVIKKDINFTVTKAIPNCQMPERLEVQTGAVLGDIALPSGFVWESSTETELKEAGEYTFYVSYNPDASNYYTVEHIPIIVVAVGKAPEPPKDDQGGNSGNTSGGGTTGGSTTGGNSGNTTGRVSSTGRTRGPTAG
ncbi:MAG: Ig-like domain-containing protein, partial [Lachnospiraceae bacterium]|nr:Ig-like domain-containing protein [Lachnospiraceae bacterium]